jgi:membrane protein YqaA with SNARE-associated domain
LKTNSNFFSKLPHYADRPWFLPILSFTAALDYAIFIIPLDAIVVASISINKKRWWSISLWSALGSTAGAVLFTLLVQYFGENYLQQWAPHLLEGKFTQNMSDWLQNHGFWALMALGALPINQHPAVAIAALANVHFTHIAFAMFTGRILRYAIYTWLIGHAQKGLTRFFKK